MNRALNSTLAALVLAPLALTGCTTNDKAGSSATPGSGALSVSATDTECTVSSATTGSGNVVFTVKNDGSKVNEFYLLASDGLRIVGEVENIGPGLTRDLVLRAAPGKYFTVCKPGMVGEGIRSEFTVTDSGVDLGVTGDDKALVDAANAAYARYVKDQTEQLLTATQKFAALYTSGKDAEARALYPVARVHWERIEPVAESFGDLDPKMDAREADLTAGQAQTRFTNELEEWLAGLTRLSTGVLGREGDSSIPAYVNALLEQTAENLEGLQTILQRGEEGRAATSNAIMTMTERLTVLTEQMRANNQVMVRVAEGQSTIALALAKMADGQDRGMIDEATRGNIRNLEIYMARLIEEVAQGRVQATAEIRNEIKILTRTIAAIAEESPRP